MLLTPEIFRDNPSSRLYGWLLRNYQRDPDLLQRHLEHRKEPRDWAAVSRRLGWLTYEDCERVSPGSCAWLPSAQQDRRSGAQGSS